MAYNNGTSKNSAWIITPILSWQRQPYYSQEAMENFVFPDEIKAKLMKMSKLMNIFYVP